MAIGDKKYFQNTGSEVVTEVLGDAAYTDPSQYATAAQGRKADEALVNETDPIFSASAAAGITASDITNWNAKVAPGDLSLYSLVTETGNKIELSLNTTTYVLTATLKDKNNNIISTSSEIDLPLETLVLNVEYVDTTEHPKSLKITLKDGTEKYVPVSGLISGLVNETTFNAHANNTDIHVTAADKTTWSGKQDALTAGDNITIENNVISAEVPTKTSDLTNDSGFITVNEVPPAMKLVKGDYHPECSLATLPSSAKWSSVAYGNDKFVSVASDSDKAAYSTDGISWTAVTMPRNEDWSSVTYGNGKFVAVARDSDYTAYSTDGINWTAVELQVFDGKWSSVTYGSGKFLAVSENYGTINSTDGINWDYGSSPGGAEWSSVTYGNGKFVAVGLESNEAAYSTDGKRWNRSSLPDYGWWESVTYGNGKFVAVSWGSVYIAYSTDGINWTTATLTDSAEWSSVTYGNGKFVTVSANSDRAAYIIFNNRITQNNINITDDVKDIILPSVTSSDAGKILMVNAQGRWDKATIPNAEDNSFGGN